MRKIFCLVALVCATVFASANKKNANFIENALNLSLRMVWVEGGEFMMGCTSEQNDCGEDEKNVRKVTLSGYYMGMLEITQEQWYLVMGTTLEEQRLKAGKSKVIIGKGEDFPMYFVSWEEATEFCKVLSEKTGKKYVLPTEAQWEYAARGGKNAAKSPSMYATLDSLGSSAWYKKNSGDMTHPVGIKDPNALGLYDMTGNVWEWCSDHYEEIYRKFDTENPQGPHSSSTNTRVNRGGSWDSKERYCRVSMRYGSEPTFRENYLGFRVVMLP